MSAQFKKMPIKDEPSEFEMGEGLGSAVASHLIAQEMRVLFCALITAHKKDDESAFFATVDIAKHQLSKYVNFDEEDWELFRNDTKRKAIG